MSLDLDSVVSTQLRVTNPGSGPLELWLEPWARLYVLEAKSSADLVFEAEAPGVPEVLHEAERIVVYAWPTAVARVLKDGIELAETPQR